MSNRARGIAGWLKHELQTSMAPLIYLTVMIGAIGLHEQVLLEGEGVHHAAYAVALGKAMVLAKFLATGEAMGIANRGLEDRPVLHRLLYRSAAFLLLLLALEATEEVVMAVVHGETFPAALAAVGGGSAARIGSGALLLWLILLPYFLVQIVSAELGPGTLRRMLTGRG